MNNKNNIWVIYDILFYFFYIFQQSLDFACKTVFDTHSESTIKLMPSNCESAKAWGSTPEGSIIERSSRRQDKAIWFLNITPV